MTTLTSELSSFDIEPLAFSERLAAVIPHPRAHRLTCAELMSGRRPRRFALPRLRKPAAMIALTTEPNVIRRILLRLGLPAELPPLAPARPSPEFELDC